MNTVIPELQYKRNHHVDRLQTHEVYLRGDHVTLRPMTEEDWDLLHRWNNDPEVMKYADHDEFRPSTLGEVLAMIGEKELWGRGYGTEAIAVLVDFGFSHEAADAIFGIVSADNARSLRAFEKCGFNRHAVVQDDDTTLSYDLVVTPV